MSLVGIVLIRTGPPGCMPHFSWLVEQFCIHLLANVIALSTPSADDKSAIDLVLHESHSSMPASFSSCVTSGRGCHLLRSMSVPIPHHTFGSFGSWLHGACPSAVSFL